MKMVRKDADRERDGGLLEVRVNQQESDKILLHRLPNAAITEIEQ